MFCDPSSLAHTKEDPVDPDQPNTPDEAVSEAPDVETTPDQPEAAKPGANASDAPETIDATSADDGTSDEGDEDDDTLESGDSFTDVELDDLPEEVQNRYRQMQADYTRKTQELAEQRAELDQTLSFVSDLVADEPSEEQEAMQEAVFQALAKRLGYDIQGGGEEGDDGEGADDEAPEFRDPRVDELLAEREAEKQAEAQREYEASLDEAEQQIEDGFKELAKTDGIDLSDEELDLLFDKVLSLPPVAGENGEDGPDLKGAYAALKKVLGINQQRWLDSKKNADTAPTGVVGEEPVNLMDEQQRIAHMARSAAGALAQQNT